MRFSRWGLLCLSFFPRGRYRSRQVMTNGGGRCRTPNWPASNDSDRPPVVLAADIIYALAFFCRTGRKFVKGAQPDGPSRVVTSQKDFPNERESLAFRFACRPRFLDRARDRNRLLLGTGLRQLRHR